MISEDHVIQYIIPVDSEYQEIRPYSAVNIDSVKINQTLILMGEFLVQTSVYWLVGGCMMYIGPWDVYWFVGRCVMYIGWWEYDLY